MKTIFKSDIADAITDPLTGRKNLTEDETKKAYD